MMRANNLWTAVGISLGLAITAGRPAQACGGFFCSQVPIDQSGEQIIFSVTPNHVTAYIQISYTGAAKDFAWVVPVAAKPEITLGSQSVFQTIGGLTQPQFRTDWAGDGGYCGNNLVPEIAGGVATGTTADRGVTVLDSRDVGPYMTVTLESHDSEQLLQWLNDNGFVQPIEAQPLIDHYVKLNMLFVALRLKQDATAGDIQPVVLDMATSEPCVPLILTRIAAQADMPVLVYVLGAARAAASNWFHVVVDPAKINWLQFGSNYRQVVTDAINQAAGHGFVTEFAGPSSLLKNAVWQAGRYDTSRLRGITDPAALVQALLSAGYPRDGSMKALLRKWIPMPDAVAARGVTEQAFYNDLAAYKADLAGAGFVLDINGFIADLEERVLMPLQRAQGLFDTQPYLTRLLSTVSPSEMTRDPIFAMNSDLPTVSNLHVAKAYGTCLNDGTVQDLKLQLEDGQLLTLDGVTRLYYGNGPWTYGGSSPPAKQIELIGSAGSPVPVQAGDVTRLDVALDTLSPAIVRDMSSSGATGPTGPTGHRATGGDGCWCALSPGSHSGPGTGIGLTLGLVAAGLLISRRRARRRR